MKRMAGQLFILTVFLGFFGIESVAQTKIRFARGRTSARVTGAITNSSVKCFILEARARQSIFVSLRSRSNKVRLDTVVGLRPYRDSKSFGTDTVEGDNEICIVNDYSSSTFILTVSIK